MIYAKIDQNFLTSVEIFLSVKSFCEIQANFDVLWLSFSCCRIQIDSKIIIFVPHGNVCLVDSCLKTCLAVWLIVCQYFVNFVCFSRFSIFIDNVGNAERSSTVVLVSFKNVEVLLHRHPQKVFLSIAIGSSECTHTVTRICKTNSRIGVLTITNLFGKLKLLEGLFTHTELFQ